MIWVNGYRRLEWHKWRHGITGISEKGSSINDSGCTHRQRCNKIGMMETEIQEDRKTKTEATERRDGNRRICGMVDMVVF